MLEMLANNRELQYNGPSNSQDNHLNQISKTNVHERSNRVSHIACNALSGISQQSRQWSDGDSIGGENDRRTGPAQIGHNPNWDEDKENISPTVEGDCSEGEHSRPY